MCVGGAGSYIWVDVGATECVHFFWCGGVDTQLVFVLCVGANQGLLFLLVWGADKVPALSCV